MIVGRFAEVRRWRGLNVNVGNNKVMVLNREKGIECKVHVDGIQ